MNVFLPILNQMIFLFAFILIGYALFKSKKIPENSATALSGLETFVFIPALIMGTFMEKCTVETLSSAWKILLISAVTLAVILPLSLVVAKLCFKERFLQNIGAYGLAFANFSFMGNAIMSAVFPEIFFEYTVFTLPFWFMIYLYGAPVLLIAEEKTPGQNAVLARLKSLANPMCFGMLAGILLGLTGLGAKLPSSVRSVVKVSGDCMSPVAMLLTGMTIAKADLPVLLKKWRLYILTAIKLLLYPALALIVCLIFQGGAAGGIFGKEVKICLLCFACMPFGLNGIVIPASYGKDTSDASAMALISHFFSVLTIPVVFLLAQYVV